MTEPFQLNIFSESGITNEIFISKWKYRVITLLAVMVIGLAITALVFFGIKKEYSSGYFIAGAVTAPFAFGMSSFSIYRLFHHSRVKSSGFEKGIDDEKEVDKDQSSKANPVIQQSLDVSMSPSTDILRKSGEEQTSSVSFKKEEVSEDRTQQSDGSARSLSETHQHTVSSANDFVVMDEKKLEVPHTQAESFSPFTIKLAGKPLFISSLEESHKKAQEIGQQVSKDHICLKFQYNRSEWIEAMRFLDELRTVVDIKESFVGDNLFYVVPKKKERKQGDLIIREYEKGIIEEVIRDISEETLWGEWRGRRIYPNGTIERGTFNNFKLEEGTRIEGNITIYCSPKVLISPDLLGYGLMYSEKKEIIVIGKKSGIHCSGEYIQIHESPLLMLAKLLQEGFIQDNILREVLSGPINNEDFLKCLIQTNMIFSLPPSSFYCLIKIFYRNNEKIDLRIKYPGTQQTLFECYPHDPEIVKLLMKIEEKVLYKAIVQVLARKNAFSGLSKEKILTDLEDIFYMISQKEKERLIDQYWVHPEHTPEAVSVLGWRFYMLAEQLKFATEGKLLKRELEKEELDLKNQNQVKEKYLDLLKSAKTEAEYNTLLKKIKNYAEIINRITEKKIEILKLKMSHSCAIYLLFGAQTLVTEKRTEQQNQFYRKKAEKSLRELAVQRASIHKVQEEYQQLFRELQENIHVRDSDEHQQNSAQSLVPKKELLEDIIDFSEALPHYSKNTFKKDLDKYEKACMLMLNMKIAEPIQ